MRSLSLTCSCVDSIIAIHGLHGGPWDTFAADFDPGNSQCKEVNWLYDILPKRLVLAGVHARIMTFGYDAQWWLKAAEYKNERRPSEDLEGSLDRIRDEVRNSVLYVVFLTLIGHITSNHHDQPRNWSWYRTGGKRAILSAYWFSY